MMLSGADGRPLATTFADYLMPNTFSAFGVHFAEMPLTPDRIVAAPRAAGAYERWQREDSCP